jgi:hypothetical protein
LSLARQIQRRDRPARTLRVVLDHRQIAQEGPVGIDPALLQIAQPGDDQAVDLRKAFLGQAGLGAGALGETNAFYA